MTQELKILQVKANVLFNQRDRIKSGILLFLFDPV